jgi:hypothetical protein
MQTFDDQIWSSGGIQDQIDNNVAELRILETRIAAEAAEK